MSTMTHSAQPATEAPRRMVEADPQLVIDPGGERIECSLSAFVSDNGTGLDDETLAEVVALGVGETYEGGGGAAAEWSVRRVS